MSFRALSLAQDFSFEGLTSISGTGFQEEKDPPKSHMVKSTVPKSPLMETSVTKSPIPRSPLPRSPLQKSPLPKSPLPKSPLPKSPVIYEKYKSRCAYGLISMFNFRRRHSSKLISDTDRRRLSRHSACKGTLQAHGDKNMKNRVDLRSDQRIDDELNYKTAAVVSGNCQLVHDRSRNQRKATKSSRRSLRLPVYGCYDVSTVRNTDSSAKNLAPISSKSLESAVASEVLPNQGLCPENKADRDRRSTISMHYDQVNEINLQVNVNEATEAFINKKLIDGKHVRGDGVSHQSKHFLDALQILNSNKDLFIKLLQDPNSLLVKHIEDLRELQTKEEQDNRFTKAASEHEKSNTKDSNLSKSEETDDCQPLENIVVLRPNRISHGSPQDSYRLTNVQQSVKPAFFPFEQMKRKLMGTMGISRKKKQLMLTDGAARRRPIRDSEEFKGCDKRTVIEMFTRKSPDKASQRIADNEQLEMHRKTSDHLCSNVRNEHKRIASSINNSNQLDMKFVEYSEEISPAHGIGKSDGFHKDAVNQSNEAVDKCAESGSLDFSRLDSNVEIKTSSSELDDHLSSPSNVRNFREFDRIENNAEQPSPVSVLDQFFTDDMSSPSNTESQPALPSIRRLQIGKEDGCFTSLQFPVDLKLNSDTSTEEYKSMFEFVSTVLQACGLNWDELARKYQITNQLLDQSVFNGINVWPKSCHDHMLLLDYVNEVLVDICWHNLRCSPWISTIKPGILSTMITGSIPEEVMKNVDWNLLSAPPLQRLEEITERDLHASRSWMDIRVDAEDVVSEMVDSLVEELTTEIALE